ncbi:dihydropteroate synthase [Alteromonas sp. ASW11-19]|uniref:Dihydropteroate synthase n=1 Tax=Alteromonas salexigens TaxID=2982530 RepID=A0ABT2VPD0_9ALTE|nr:dihydropteroate synthase [Alteromonas salexigens]MCU7554323.1 dihydropteroate synthase [Alteromonas salexigens]
MKFCSRTIPLTTPSVMGILNVTPDSFSDGGQHDSVATAVAHGESMVAAGAAFIDVGGESTRPGAPAVSEQEELDRVIPVIEALSSHVDAVISIDTSKAVVMREAVAAGATLINDVRALQEPGALSAAAKAGVPVCLMHMQGQPRTMQDSPQYKDVTRDVSDFLMARVAACRDAGISDNSIILDPGFGFGKALAHNYQLLNGLPELMRLGFPLLVGMSRKSMIGQVINRPVNERLAGSVTLATIAANMGAHILRVHDVQETADAVAIVNMLRAQQQ